MVRGRLAALGAFAAATALVLTGCANQGGAPGAGGGRPALPQAPAPGVPADVALPAGNGQARCAPGSAIAFVGSIKGSSPALAEPIRLATQLAVEQHNQANPGCQVTYQEADSEGAPAKAPGPVVGVINNPAVLGIVGLPFSGESKAVGKALSDAGLVNISPSATNPGLATSGFTTFFRGMGNDTQQGDAASRFLKEQFNPQSVCVIRDDSDYGVGLADQVTRALGPQVASCQDSVKTDQREFSATVGKVTQAKPQVVFYAGYYPEAAPLAAALRGGGVQATFVGPDGVKDQEFVTNSNGAADGAFFTCPCVPSDGFTDFTNAYQQKWGKAPSTYAPEAYDAATVLLKGIDSGNSTRPALLNFVRNYDGQGLTKRLSWNPNGELKQVPMWSYQVAGGQIQRLRPLS